MTTKRPTSILHTGSAPLAARLLRAAIIEPWESVDQVIESIERDSALLGDPTREGTGAWHLRHIVEVFRLHARTVMAGAGDPAAAATLPPPEASIPDAAEWSPRLARDELLADVETFCAWLAAQSDDTLSEAFNYGRRVDVMTMLSVMLQHITWHAAAVHYWRKWKASPG